MCCLFGIYNYSGEDIKDLSKVTNALAREATARGTDATGIAYNHKGSLVIHKEPKSAYQIKFKHHDNVTAVMGHTRHTTQGNEKMNYNNHPFAGKCRNTKFALAHNGILINDKSLRRNLKLPKTKIETDSYIAVQLIEQQKYLNHNTIKQAVEKIEGSYSFSILDETDILWLIKGDSPLSIIHFPKLRLYAYASTTEILYKGLVETDIFREVKRGFFEEIEITEGQILRFCSDGTIICDKFDYKERFYNGYGWWGHDYGFLDDDTYLDDLKSVAKTFGYDEETIDALMEEGFSPDEIEEYIYCCELKG